MSAEYPREDESGSCHRSEIEEILEERGEEYGQFSEIARTAQTLKSVMLEDNPHNLGDMTDVMREALDLICSKLARIRNNPNHLDSWVDIGGYAQLVVKSIRG